MLDQENLKDKTSESPHKSLNPEVVLASEGSDCKPPLVGDLHYDIAHLPYPSQPEGQALWKQAERFMQEDRIQEAVEMLKQCIDSSPDLEDQFIGLGCFEDRIGYHYGPLWEWVQMKKQEQGKQGSPFDLLSLCLSQGQNYQTHKQWYMRLIERRPHCFRAAVGLANLEYNQKKFKEAEVAYQRAAKLNPSCEQPLVRISFIYCLKWNRDGEAADWARQGLALNPKDCYGKLVAALCNRDLDLRVGELQDLIEEIPEYARPYNGLGNAFYNKKNYEDAISNYKKCIEVNGKYQHPYYGLGSIYNQLGDLDQSIIWYTRCIEVSPNYDYPHYGLGIAYNNKNDMVNAIYYFKECIRINPAYDCPYYALGNIYRLGKDYPSAIHHYRLSLQHKPVDPLCFVNLALTLVNTGQYQQAYDYFELARAHLLEDRMLSPTNIEYIRQHLEHYLKQHKKHERGCLGFLTLRERIHISTLQQQFQNSYASLYGP